MTLSDDGTAVSDSGVDDIKDNNDANVLRRILLRHMVSSISDLYLDVLRSQRISDVSVSYDQTGGIIDAQRPLRGGSIFGARECDVELKRAFRVVIAFGVFVGRWVDSLPRRPAIVCDQRRQGKIFVHLSRKQWITN